MNVGLKIVKCSKKEYEGAEWEEIHLASVNSDQFNIIHKGSALFTIYPYRTMYGRDTTKYGEHLNARCLQKILLTLKK